MRHLEMKMKGGVQKHGVLYVLFGISGLFSLSVGSVFHWTPILQLESLIGCLYTADKERTNSEKFLKSLKEY